MDRRDLGFGVHLVDHEEEFLAERADPIGHLPVQGHDPFPGIAKKEAQIGLPNSLFHLEHHLPGKRLGGSNLQAAGVHHLKRDTPPADLTVKAVPGQARLGVHQNLPPAHQAVEQGGFSHVGSSDDGDDGKG
jgi:hypothetical protein